MTDAGAESLRDGSTLSIEHLGPGEGRGTGPAAQELLAFITQPMSPWFSAAEAAGLTQCLSGAAHPALADHLFVGRREGRLAGAVWHGTAADRPMVGVFGYVWTDPAARGLGIARALTRRSVDRFWADGGQASYLGTAEPTARRVYEDHGYRAYHGAVMRALRPGLDADDHEADWFEPGAPVTVRDATFADVAAYTALVTHPGPAGWRVRDWTERLFVIPPLDPINSCTRPFLSTWVRHVSAASNVFRVATVPGGGVVAAVAIASPATGALAGSGTLEILAHPAHMGAAAPLIADALGRAAVLGVREVRAWADRGDRADLLVGSAFREESVQPGMLTAGEERIDVVVLRAELALPPGRPFGHPMTEPATEPIGNDPDRPPVVRSVTP